MQYFRTLENIISKKRREGKREGKERKRKEQAMQKKKKFGPNT